MKRLALLFLFATLAAAQTTEPKLSDSAHAKIRDLQLQMTQLQIQFTGLQQQLSIQVDAAYAEAKASKEDYTLDMNSLTFSKIKKPEAKKP